MTRLAQLIATQEGFYRKGALDRPQKDHNPGDLRHAPYGIGRDTNNGKDPEGLVIFPDDKTGFAALDRQLHLYASRGMTLRQVVYAYAPPTENDSQAYLTFVAKGMNCSPDIPVAQLLGVMAA